MVTVGASLLWPSAGSDLCKGEMQDTTSRLFVWSGTRGLLVISFLSGLGSGRSAGTPCPMGQKSILESVNALGEAYRT